MDLDSYHRGRSEEFNQEGNPSPSKFLMQIKSSVLEQPPQAHKLSKKNDNLQVRGDRFKTKNKLEGNQSSMTGGESVDLLL